VWVRPPVVRGSSLPYAQEDLDHAAAALEELEGVAVTGTGLQERRVSERVEIHPVLRRRDLLDLFDTAPDLSGNDLDVTQWIRDADATTTGMVWRGVGDDGEPDESMPGREELCQVPVGELRALVGVKGRRAWVFDQADGRWRRAATGEVRPGGLVVLDAAQGGYLPDRGWVPDSRVPVEPVLVDEQVTPDGIGADPLTVTGRGRWVTVTEHLDDVRREVDRLFGEYGDGLPGLSAHHREAAVLAGLYHDVGKAHPVFANSLERLAGRPLPGGPWAKSGERGRVRHDPPHFRHELVSALMVADPVAGLLDGVAEADLVAYLVAAHHGMARLTIRSAPGENGDRVLGVSRVDGSLPVVLPDGQHLPALTLHREVLELGSDGTGASWQTRACTLRDRADVGPFRLAFLEAVVRVADWRVSARYDEGATS